MAKSTMDAEHISYSMAVSIVVRARRFIDNLQLELSEEPINLFSNNKSTIFLVKNGANSSIGKHININYHYMQDIVERREIKVDHVPSGKMVADHMTKGLSMEKFKEHVTTTSLRIIWICSHNM